MGLAFSLARILSWALQTKVYRKIQSFPPVEFLTTTMCVSLFVLRHTFNMHAYGWCDTHYYHWLHVVLLYKCANVQRNKEFCKQRQVRGLQVSKYGCKLSRILTWTKNGFCKCCLRKEMHSTCLLNPMGTHNVFWWVTLYRDFFFFIVEENSTGQLSPPAHCTHLVTEIPTENLWLQVFWFIIISL